MKPWFWRWVARFGVLYAVSLVHACSSDGESGTASAESSFARDVGNPEPVAGTTLTTRPGALPGSGDNLETFTSMGSSIGGGRAGNRCLEATVYFVIDGSGSMCEAFGGSTRWQALRDALVGSSGVVTQLAEAGTFGMLIYSGSIDIFLSMAQVGGPPPPACSGFALFGQPMMEQQAMPTCEQFIEVPQARDNAEALAEAYPMMEPGGSTPTDRALSKALEALAVGLDQDSGGGRYIVLATDGQPNDICIGGQGGDGTAQQQAVLALVDEAAKMGIITFVVSLASGDPSLQAHLDEVARHGDPLNDAARTYNPTSPEDLASDLKYVLGSAFSCVLE